MFFLFYNYLFFPAFETGTDPSSGPFAKKFKNPCPKDACTARADMLRRGAEIQKLAPVASDTHPSTFRVTSCVDREPRLLDTNAVVLLEMSSSAQLGTGHRLDSRTAPTFGSHLTGNLTQHSSPVWVQR